MKRCPECRRDYYDDTLLYCLDDGNALLEGPATASGDEPATAILHSTASPGEAPTRAQIHTTEQTAVFPRGAEAEPQRNLSDSTEKHSFSARRMAKPLIATVVTVAVLVGGFFGYKYFAPARQINSIAVMPFENRNSDADTDYLSDGLAESVIFRLTQIPDLRVSPTSSVMRYKGKETDIAKIASELGVDAVMTGRLTKRGDNLNITVELVDARTNKSLWGEQYERKLSELLTTQREMVAEIVSKLQLKLSGESEQKLAKKYTDNNEAYQLYLKGRFHWNKRRISDAKKSVELFQQAIDIDPNYALGYAGLADGYALLGNLDGAPPLDVMPKAKIAAEKAISLDNNLSEAYATLGIVLTNFEYDFSEAERVYKRAIESDPNNATSYFYYSQLLSRVGRHDEAIKTSQKAVELEPFASYINNFYGGILHLARRYSEAELQLNKTIELDPNFPPVYLNLFSVYQMQGRYAESVEAFAKYQELLGQQTVAVSARESFAKGGWEGFLRKMPSEPDLKIYRNRFLAIFYTALGEKQKAIDELEQEYEKRGSFANGIKVFPALDPLREEPRFKELVRKVGIPE